MNPAKNQNLWHQCQLWVKLQLTLHLLLLTILQLYLLPPPPPPPISKFSCYSLNASACMPAACCTVLLYFSRYFPVILKMLSFFVLFIFLGIIVCKPITVKYYIADCVSWVPRLSLLNSWTHWTYECALEMEFIHMNGTYSSLY